MKALIFAAGLGERMRPLTHHTPKPLLPAGDKPLIVWHLEKLAARGVTDVVINTSWLAGQFPQMLGDGSTWGVRLHYSYEGATPLETGGGMLHALPVLGSRPFIAVNGDIWTDYDFDRLPSDPAGEAHLVLVNNPAHNPDGDFHLTASSLLASDGPLRLTFSGIGVYRPALLHRRPHSTAQPEVAPARFKLAPLLRSAMDEGRISGEHHGGRWTDVGTPQRLQQLDEQLGVSVRD